MSIQSRDCDYCVRATVWRAGDPVPLKCHHCGAPPKAVKPATDALAMLRIQADMQMAQMQNMQGMYLSGPQQQNFDPWSQLLNRALR